MPRRRSLPVLLAAVGCAVACGSRTGLLVPLDVTPEDAGEEAGVDAGPDALDETAPDVTVDVSRPDVRMPEEDALPPIDVTPPVDVGSTCPDAGSTYVYLISAAGDLLSFYPPTAAFTTIGRIGCNDPQGPNSMAVDTSGVAYVGFNSGNIYRVSTLTASCRPTPFRSTPEYTRFGMGFSSNFPASGETLFLASNTLPTLATVDTNTFALHVIGNLQPSVSGSELTGTGAGDLFAFFDVAGGSAIGQLDKASARIVAESPLPGITQGQGWAFAFWGGDFYTFTAPGSFTEVHRYRPSTHSITQVATTPGTVIVGAGVSTCAPQQ